MLCCPGKMEALILEGMVNVNDLLHLFRNVFFKIFFQKADQILFFIIPDYNIYILIQLTHIRLRLHITAGRYDHCIRILFSGTMDHLSGLAVRHIGHGACIDHIDIRILRKRHDLISRLLQNLLHGFRLICIHFTTQIMQCCFHSCFLISVLLFVHAFLWFHPLFVLTFPRKTITIKLS